MVVWGGLTNSWEKKRSERQGRKGNIYPYECRVPKNGKEIKKAFLSDQWKQIEENNRMGKIRDRFKKIRHIKGTFHASQSVQFSCSVVSDSLRPHESQHASPPCPSPAPKVHSNSCPSSQWCHPAISSSVIPFSSCPQSLPASGSFPMSQFWSFSFSISPSNEHPGLISFRMDWLDIFAVQGTLRSLLQHHSSKASILQCSAFLIVHLSHPYMTIGNTIAQTRWTFVSKVMSLLFNMLFRLVITFLPRSKRLLISWLQSPSAVILEPKKMKSDTFYCLRIYFPWGDGTRCHDLSFLNVKF